MLKSRALFELKIKCKKKETIKSLQLLTVLAHLNKHGLNTIYHHF
jgi:hypothetical protein